MQRHGEHSATPLRRARRATGSVQARVGPNVVQRHAKEGIMAKEQGEARPVREDGGSCIRIEARGRGMGASNFCEDVLAGRSEVYARTVEDLK